MTTTTTAAAPSTNAAQAAASEPDVESLAKRVDDAISALNQLDDGSRAVAEEVKAAIEAVHRAGLITMVRRMRADDAARPID